MSIVGETLACRQKSRNVQDRYAVAVVRTDTEPETETDTGEFRHDCRASATENILPMFSFFVVAVPSTSRASYTWHGNTKFRYKEIFENLIFVIGSPYEN